jgi:cellulose biosynthesis protein BcsQ
VTAPIILIANTAGGTGKTTTAHALSVASAEYGKSVLAIDADPSATLTFLNGIENPRVSVAELLQDSSALQSAMTKCPERFSLIPGASRAFGHNGGWDWITALRSDFDLIVIDTPSGPSPALRDLATFATLTLIPLPNIFLALRGAVHVMDFLASTKSNSTIAILPVQSEGIREELRELLPGNISIIEPAIRSDIAILEAESTSRSVLTSSPQSAAASDYREVTYSILEAVGLF